MAAAKKPDMVYLKESHVIGMSLPLHPVIEERWRAGTLQRVNADGSPWHGGDQYAVLGQPGPDSASSQHPQTTDTALTADPDGAPGGGDSRDGGDGRDGQPARPKGNASRAEWAKYAVDLGVCTQPETDLLTRDELIKATTPPEMQPPDPGA
jgi:hypothetical protein